MSGSEVQVRQARQTDIGAVAALAAELAQSFTFDRPAFDANFPALLANADTRVLVALDGNEGNSGDCIGYLLGFWHLTFYANGPVGWVEEILVRPQDQGRGIGQALMTAFEQQAAAQGCALVALATRRAAPFYRALGYQESATYFRKLHNPT